MAASPFQLKEKLNACALCGEQNPLRLSHILPAFAYRWMKATSATGHIRMKHNPNLRAQDGAKAELLCGACEQLFSDNEGPFASDIFVPLHERNESVFRYKEWLLKFCVSVSWRVLIFHKLCGLLDSFPENAMKSINGAIEVWREFLLGKRDNPAQYAQHFLMLDTLESSSGMDLPPNINRYFRRAIQMDVKYFPDGGAFVFSKLGRFALFGLVDLSDAKKWKGSKVKVSFGDISPTSVAVPGYVGKYLCEQARHIIDINRVISEKQLAKIEETIRNNPDQVTESDLFEAMCHDVERFGIDAFFNSNRDIV